MCKAFKSNPPLSEDKPQAEASKEPVSQPISQKRKGKKATVEEPNKKKSKPSDPPSWASDNLKIGGQDAPPPSTPRRSTRLAASASLPVAQAEPRSRTSSFQASPPVTSLVPS